VRKLTTRALLCALALAVAASAVAVAGTKNGVTFSTKYSTQRAGKPTGFTAHIAGAPRDANGLLDPARQVVLTFEPGTEFDTSVPGECTAQKLQEGGAAACPADTVVGSGSAEAISGIAALDPIRETVTVFNADGGILFYLVGRQTFTITGQIKGSKVVAHVPALPIPGNPKGAVLTKFDVVVKRVHEGRRAYVSSPETCDGRWTVRATFKYPNVPDISNVVSNTRCKRTRSR
jgi:hypothetical protein